MAYCLVAIALYVLSVGPSVWIWNRCRSNHFYDDEVFDAIGWIYQPLGVLVGQSETMGNLLVWYAELWGTMPQKTIGGQA